MDNLHLQQKDLQDEQRDDDNDDKDDAASDDLEIISKPSLRSIPAADQGDDVELLAKLAKPCGATTAALTDPKLSADFYRNRALLQRLNAPEEIVTSEGAACQAISNHVVKLAECYQSACFERLAADSGTMHALQPKQNAMLC